MNVKQFYLYCSGTLTLKDYTIYEDVLCIDINHRNRSYKGMPARSILFLNDDVAPFSVRYIDIQKFEKDANIPIEPSII